MDLSSRGCLLNETNDGMVLSSFQLLNQGNPESYRDNKDNGRELDHFLHSLSDENNNQDTSHWSNDTRNHTTDVPNPFPLHLNTMSNSEAAMLQNFEQRNDNSGATELGDSSGSCTIGGRKNVELKEGVARENNVQGQTARDDGDGQDTPERAIGCLEEQDEIPKTISLQESCNGLQLSTISAQREDDDNSSKQISSSHPSHYLHMPPVLSHSVYLDSSNEDIWHHDTSKNEFCSDIKETRSHQLDCISTNGWPSDKAKESSKKDNTILTNLDTQTVGDQPQTWDFLQGDDEDNSTHQLLPAPSFQTSHHPHQHWPGGMESSANSNHHQQHAASGQHQRQQQQHNHPQPQQQHKSWIPGKKTWGIHNTPTDDGGKSVILSQNHWANHNGIGWQKELGYSVDADVERMHMFQIAQTGNTDSPVPHTPYRNNLAHPVVCNSAISLPHHQTWSLGSNHLATAATGALHPHQAALSSMGHLSQPNTTNFFQENLHLPVSSSPACHFAGPTTMPPIMCNSNLNVVDTARKTRTVCTRRRAASAPDLTVPRCKSALEQHRPNSHPYLPKDPKVARTDGFAGCATRCNLKASHLVSWYIDYLIHENENLTQISRAFSLPVNLFHSDDFYFMDSVKKKAHFPSLKFLSWMQQKLPNINVNSVDFLEGRPPVVSMWNQDWFWQNKSRRDIIHDVFFYFQHRRVAYPN